MLDIIYYLYGFVWIHAYEQEHTINFYFNVLVYRFTSNSFENGLGFQLRYESSDSTHWSYSFGSYGGSFENRNGILNSPNYPSSYQRVRRDYTYNISVPTINTVIVINFLRMDLPKGDCEECYYDYLEFRDGPNDDSPRLHSFVCGTEIPPPIISSQSQLLMKQVNS